MYELYYEVDEVKGHLKDLMNFKNSCLNSSPNFATSFVDWLEYEVDEYIDAPDSCEASDVVAALLEWFEIIEQMQNSDTLKRAEEALDGVGDALAAVHRSLAEQTRDVEQYGAASLSARDFKVFSDQRKAAKFNERMVAAYMKRVQDLFSYCDIVGARTLGRRLEELQQKLSVSQSVSLLSIFAQRRRTNKKSGAAVRRHIRRDSRRKRELRRGLPSISSLLQLQSFSVSGDNCGATKLSRSRSRTTRHDNNGGFPRVEPIKEFVAETSYNSE